MQGGGPYAALAEAWTAGFLKDIPAAIDVIKRAEARYPDDPTLPAYRAQLAILIDDREQVKEAIARSLAIDPDDPTALEARANYKAGIESDLEGALADLTRAAKIAPGSTTIWNALGNRAERARRRPRGRGGAEALDRTRSERPRVLRQSRHPLSRPGPGEGSQGR